MTTIKDRNAQRRHRHARVRAQVHGTPERPRLVVFKSLKHISAQVIDDVNRKTLASASDASLKKGTKAATVEIAKEVGRMIGKKAKAAKIAAVVFDRGGNAYHGQVKALADGAREEGLTF